MVRQRFFSAFTLIFFMAFAAVGWAAPPTPPPAPGLTAVPGSFSANALDADVSVNAAAIPPAAQMLHLTFALKSSRLAGLPALLQAQQDPKSPDYHHWLTPSEFAARFGADDADVQTVVDYATAQGFTPRVVPNHLFVEVDSTVSHAESAFHILLRGYNRADDQIKAGESSTFYAPSAAPLLPAAVANRLNGVFGLTNFVQLHPRVKPDSLKPEAQKPISAPKKNDAPLPTLVPIQDVIKDTAGLSSFGGFPLPGSATPSLTLTPSFSSELSPAQLSKVYEFDPLHALGLTGSGYSVGIYSPTGLTLSDVNNFAATYGISGYSLVVINTDGGNTNLGNQLEAGLDVETIIGQASHATVYIYEEPNDGSLNAWNRIASDNVAVISNSWGIGENYCHTHGLDSYISSWGTVLSQMQSQGMAHYVATGDNGAFSGGVSTVNMPSSHPGSTAVGGTENLTDSSGYWASETGWSGSGGGLSIYWGRPSWQAGPGVINGYSNGYRQVPDVSALGGPTPGYSIYVGGNWYHAWGTSASTPLWASANVLMNQGIGGRFGSLNPRLYDIGTYVNAFDNAEVYHDTTTGNNGYPTTAKWDFVTGWGSARFWKLYADCALPADVLPYTPGGWNTPIMISSSASTFSEPATFNNLTTYYITGSFDNIGSADARSSYLNVGLDGTAHTVNIISDPVGYFVYYQNMYSTTLSLGPHTFTLNADYYDNIYESNNSNNGYTRTITVRPYNNDFAQPFFLGGTSGSQAGTNAYANKESGEPNHAGRTGGASVWYYWTAPSTGYYNFNTYGSSFDTVLGVYTGSSVGSLTTIAGNDDAGGTYQSSVTFLAVAGRAYRIAVDGYGAATGNIALNWGQTAPTNDYFANAQYLGNGVSGTVSGSNVLATKESGEPNHGGRTGGASVWYYWTAPSTGDYNFNTVGSNFDTILGVYTGTSVSALTTVAGDDDSDGTVQSSASFHAISGTVYYIAVDGYAAHTGSITLNWQKVGLVSLGLSPASLSIGASSTGTVTLNLDASQTGGSVVTLSSSNANITIPTTVTVTGGKTATFPIKANAGSVGSVTLTATYNGTTKTATLTVSKSTPTLTVANVTGTIGQTVTLSATLKQAGDNAPMSARSLVFKVGATTVGTATTNGSGVATVAYAIPSNSSPSGQTITVSFAGSSSYNAVTATGTLTETVSLPAAPTNLHATAGNAQVTLTWTAPTGPVTSYTLYRGTSAASLTTLKTGITTTSFTNTALTNGTTYYYAVAAVNGAGTGPKSSTVSAKPTSTSLPAAPTSLHATAGNAQVTLTWTAPAGTVTSYTLYRGTSAASLTTLKTGITTTTFTNTALTNGTTYYYAVAAVNASGTGAKSSVVSATPTGVPAAPTNLHATAGSMQVTLTWTAPTGPVTSYTLSRGTSAASLTTLKTGITATTFTNVSLTHGTTYYYTVKAVNASGTGPASNEVSATP